MAESPTIQRHGLQEK